MNREEQFDFAAFFTAKLKERGLSLKKLSELSGISMQDLKNLSEGDFESLPPGPYLRGYTQRLAKILEFDPEIWWQYFENIGVVKTSGMHDELPVNRFAIPRAKRYGWIITLVVVILLYGGLRFSKIMGQPTITVSDPSDSPAKVVDANIVLRGTLDNGDQLTVNGETVTVSGEQWFKDISLQPGLNTIEIQASKRLGKQTILVRQIFYEPPAGTSTITPLMIPSSTPTSGPNTASSTNSSSS
ncbi:MAG: helix-turn-helix domain-containing protein [Candidatus Liptonbacteria bacterium]